MAFLDIPFVSTALALIVSWAMFAILCSLLHETIAQLKAERGRFMKNYLFQQLKDVPNGVNWASILYLNGTLNLLSRENQKPTNEITPRVFAEALVGAVAGTHLVQVKRASLASEDREPLIYKTKLLADFKLATQVLNPSDTVSLFTQALTDAELKTSAVNNEDYEAQVYKNLLINLQTWFDDFTNRLTLWYKKKTRQRLFVLGSLLGLIINVDTIQLFSFFSEYPQARDAYLTYYKQNETSLARLAGQLDTLKVLTPAQQLPQLDTLVSHLTPVVKTADTLRKAYALPVGYEYSVFKKSVPVEFKAILYKLVGILLTGFAASFGAPFWFDVLRKAYSN